MNEENLCFWDNKRVFALDHGPKGRKIGQGMVISLLNLFFTTAYPAIEIKNGSKLLNHKKKPILNHERNTSNNNLIYN